MPPKTAVSYRSCCGLNDNRIGQEYFGNGSTYILKWIEDLPGSIARSLAADPATKFTRYSIPVQVLGYSVRGGHTRNDPIAGKLGFHISSVVLAQLIEQFPLRRFYNRAVRSVIWLPVPESICPFNGKSSAIFHNVQPFAGTISYAEAQTGTCLVRDPIWR